MSIFTHAGVRVNPTDGYGPVDVPADDRAWWLQNGVDFYSDPDSVLDDEAVEAEALARLERGLHPDDVAAVFGYRAEHDHGDAECRGCWGGHDLD